MPSTIDTAPVRSVLTGHGSLTHPISDLGAALRRARRLGPAESVTLIGADGSRSSLDYAGLADDAERVVAGIRSVGDLPTGTPVLIRTDDPEELLVAFWACQFGGWLPLPLRVAATGPGDLDAVRAFAPDAVVVGEPVHGPEALPHLGRVGALRATRADLPDGDEAEARGHHRPDPHDPAVLLLTSGSTGRPKAVTLTHRNILSRTEGTILARGLTADQRSFNWLPLDHVGGLVMFHVRDVVLACHQTHASMTWVLADPVRWIEAMSADRSTNTWAPNFAFTLVTDLADRLTGQTWDLSRLGYVMNGGEPIKPATARRFLQLLGPYGLPPTAMHPGWGMSETSSGVVDRVFDPEASEDERFVRLGLPHAGVTLRVVDDAGDILPFGTVGRLQATGAAVTPGYFRNPEQNRQSFTPDGWFKTGDLAAIDEGGLVVTGRADDVLELPRLTCYGHEIEAAVEEDDDVEPSFVVTCTLPPARGASGPDHGTAPDGERLVVVVSLRPGADQDAALKRLRALVHTRFGVADALVLAVPRHRIPKSGIGKRRRSLLREELLRDELLRAEPAGGLLLAPPDQGGPDDVAG